MSQHAQSSGHTQSSSHTHSSGNTQSPRRGRSALINAALLLAVAIVIAGSFLIGKTAQRDADSEPFGGTDATVTANIESDNPHYTPWFSPIIELESPELESGFFAAQAAIGAGVLGYVIGRLRSRTTAASAKDNQATDA